MPNADLLNRTYEHIAAHPEEWDQAAWARKSACGTACCFAGRAVALAYPDAVFEFTTEIIAGDESEDSYNVLLPGDTAFRSIRGVAQELLGLGEGDADRLFDPTNELPDLAVAIENILYSASLTAEGGAL